RDYVEPAHAHTGSWPPPNCSFQNRYRCRAWFSSHHNVHTGRITELPQRLLALLPCQPKDAHVRHAKSCNHPTKRVHVALIKLPFHHRVFSPVHQLLQRYGVMEIGGDLFSHDLLGNDHGSNYTFWCPVSTGNFW